MPRFLTPEWVKAIEEATKTANMPPVPGATARFQYRITDGPDGDVEYWEDTVDGQLQTLEIGTIDDPDFTFKAHYDHWRAIRRGEASFWEAFDDGRVTIEGNVDAFRRLATVRDAAHYAEHAARVRALTDW